MPRLFSCALICLHSVGVVAMREVNEVVEGTNTTACPHENQDPDTACSACLPGGRNRLFPECADREVLKVILIRHGQSAWNKHEVAAALRALKNKNDPTYHDARLTQLGITQAQGLQNYFAKFVDFPAEDIQLAGSGLSRAYDTAVIATKRLWSSWDRSDDGSADYKIDMVPALMEFGNVDTWRKVQHPGIEHPTQEDGGGVVWLEDSMFGYRSSTEESKTLKYAEVVQNALGDEKYEAAQDQFYKTDELEPTKARARPEFERRANFEKTGKVFYSRGSVENTCNPEQIHFLESYLLDVARQGKKVVIAGTHSHLIRCAVNSFDVKPYSNDGDDPLTHVPESISVINADGEEVELKLGETGDVRSKKVRNGGFVELTMNFDYKDDEWLHSELIQEQGRCHFHQVEGVERSEKGCMTFEELRLFSVQKQDADPEPLETFPDDTQFEQQYGGMSNAYVMTGMIDSSEDVPVQKRRKKDIGELLTRMK